MNKIKQPISEVRQEFPSLDDSSSCSLTFRSDDSGRHGAPALSLPSRRRVAAHVGCDQVVDGPVHKSSGGDGCAAL